MTIINLENSNASLKDVYLITGQGVTSNIYVFTGETLTIVDSGNGAEENRIRPKLKEIFSTIPNVSKTILTHFHFDHIRGLDDDDINLTRQETKKFFKAMRKYYGK